jgi:hypothetical protein
MNTAHVGYPNRDHDKVTISVVVGKLVVVTVFDSKRLLAILPRPRRMRGGAVPSCTRTTHVHQSSLPHTRRYFVERPHCEEMTMLPDGLVSR